MTKNEESDEIEKVDDGFLTEEDIVEDVRITIRKENLDLFRPATGELQEYITKLFHVMYDVPFELNIVSELRKQIGETTYACPTPLNEWLGAVWLANAVHPHYYAKFENALFLGILSKSTELVQTDTLFVKEWISYIHHLRDRYSGPTTFMNRLRILRPTHTAVSHPWENLQPIPTVVSHPWEDTDVRIILKSMMKNVKIYTNKKC